MFNFFWCRGGQGKYHGREFLSKVFVKSLAGGGTRMEKEQYTQWKGTVCVGGHCEYSACPSVH